MKWKSTIGLEIHAQIMARSKLFSGALTSFGSAVNSSVNLLDAAMPGCLPTLNRACVEKAVLSSHALSCETSRVSHFDRKHYFYADLPCGYQITQQRSPIALNGHIDFFVYSPGVHKSPYKKRCRLKQIQIEQDSGKSLHDLERRMSWIDLNRAGVGLLEFVFEPDLADGEEAAALVKELALILERLQVCSCKMEEGALRIDANISISDTDKLGTRTEVKNIGSVRGVANAIQFEIERQIEVVTKGGTVINETRGWDAQNKVTVPMRQKEDVHDYRFMPEPNLPPLRVCLSGEVGSGEVDLRGIVSNIPELPAKSRSDLISKHGFSEIYAIMLVNRPELLTAFKIIMSEKPERKPKLVWNVLLVQLLNVVNSFAEPVDAAIIKPDCLGQVVDLLHENTIDFETCRNILELKIKGSPQSPLTIVEENKWRLVSDLQKIDAICVELLQRHPKSVKKVRKGKQKALQTIVNDAVNLTTEKLNMSLVAKRLSEMISGEKE